MGRFFTFFQNYRSGIILFVVVLFTGVFLLQWLAWIFARGRFKRDAGRFKRDAVTTTGTGTGTGTGDGSSKAARFVLTEAAVKIINEFRHLLALLILVIFGFALAYSLIKAGSLTTGDAITNLKGALEGVVATLGGLVGSIIGYYFGESSVVKPVESRPATESAPPVQSPPKGEGEKKAPPPPPAKPTTETGETTPEEGGSTGS